MGKEVLSGRCTFQALPKPKYWYCIGRHRAGMLCRIRVGFEDRDPHSLGVQLFSLGHFPFRRRDSLFTPTWAARHHRTCPSCSQECPQWVSYGNTRAGLGLGAKRVSS